MSKYVEVCQWQDIITSTFNHLKVAKLEAEVKKWKLEVCKWQDIDTENQKKIEKLEARIVLLEKQKENLKIDFRERLSTVVNIVDEQDKPKKIQRLECIGFLGEN